MRAELQRDYTPVNAQERLLVDEVAHCWRRLEQARNREDLFFDLQKTSMAIRCGESPDAFKEEGGEVRMWIDKPHKAYDQVLRSIRDAGVAFDRAIRRIEQVRARRLSRERVERNDEERQAKARAKTAATITRQRGAANSAEFDLKTSIPSELYVSKKNDPPSCPGGSRVAELLNRGS
jgi:hypothetical protein